MKRLIYIYQQKDWPNFSYNTEILVTKLTEVSLMQGKLTGLMHNIGFDLIKDAIIETITTEVSKTAEIEGEQYALDQVRSSIVKRMGLKQAGVPKVDRSIEGIVEVIMEATANYKTKLTKKKLCEWQKLMFPLNKSGNYTILTGKYRDDSTGAMQIISGAWGKEKVHFEAPPAKTLNAEMQLFLDWFNAEQNIPHVIKAGIAHFWFVTLHPFEDGNGRLGRLVSEILLCKSDGTHQRFYSMSAQIRKDRKEYYAILQKTSQQQNLDLTKWLYWFLDTLYKSIESAFGLLDNILFKNKFWNTYAQTINNPRQTLMLNKLLDGFEGNCNATKWAKICKCSHDSALRDIKELIDRKILYVVKGTKGKNIDYKIKRF